MTSFRTKPAYIGRGTLLLVLCMILTTGFQTPSPKARPFHGAYSVSSTTITQGPPTQLLVAGTGTSTHLGWSRVVANTTILTTTTPAEYVGDITFTAANGDQFFATFTGTSINNGDGTVTLVRTYDITGGTGRFGNADGELFGYSYDIPENELPNVGTIIFEGEISY